MTAPATAAGVVYPPAGRRRQHVTVIPCCPFCRGAHLHRGLPAPTARRAGCGQGAYLIDAGSAVAA